MIASLLARLGRANPAVEPVLPALQAPLAVIGDIHGRMDLLTRMLDQLAAHPQAGRLRVVLVGDLIDRGPASLQVLARVHALERAPDPFAAVICLMGNHERMLLDMLADPLGAGPRWLAAGGAASVDSFGLTLPHARGRQADGPAPLVQLAQDLSDRLGPLRAWLAELPLFWHEKGVFVSHAGADARHSLTAQPREGLLWGRQTGTQPHPEALVIHGHVIVPEARLQAGHINVDTGAWRSGCLSAVVLGPDQEPPVYLQARSSE